MTKSTMGSSPRQIRAAIGTLERAGFKVNVVMADAAVVTPSAPAVRTFATKAERAAGDGFGCPNCARDDLRVAPVVGRSFHDKDVKGSSVVCDLR